MILLKRNEKPMQYFKHNDILEVGELVAVKSVHRYGCQSVPATASVIVRNQRERIGTFMEALNVDLDTLDYVSNKELEERHFQKQEDVNFENCPNDCEYLLIVPDMYGTGDSPTGYDCDCPLRKYCPLFKGDI